MSTTVKYVMQSADEGGGFYDVADFDDPVEAVEELVYYQKFDRKHYKKSRRRLVERTTVEKIYRV